MPHPRNTANPQALRALGRAVRQARTQAGLFQHQVADEVGVTRGTIANIERGSQNTTVGVLFAVAMACETTLDDLVASAAKLWK